MNFHPHNTQKAPKENKERKGKKHTTRTFTSDFDFAMLKIELDVSMFQINKSNLVVNQVIYVNSDGKNEKMSVGQGLGWYEPNWEYALN